MVVRLWMVVIDLLPRLANLFDDEEVGLGLNDPFDPRLFVAGDHDEAVTLTHNLLVSGGCHLDGVKARDAVALAMKRQRPGDGVLFGASRDPLVHFPEDLLVAGGSLSEVHRRDHPF
jgi:hypothetical protein